MSCFPFLPLLPLHFIFFNFLLPKNNFDSLFDSLTVVVRQKLLFVLDTPGDEVFSSFFKIINKILRRLNNREEEEEEEEEEER